eukprot:339099_1
MQKIRTLLNGQTNSTKESIESLTDPILHASNNTDSPNTPIENEKIYIGDVLEITTKQKRKQSSPILIKPSSTDIIKTETIDNYSNVLATSLPNESNDDNE